MDASLEENSNDSTAFTPSSSIKANFSASSPMMAGGTLSGLTRASGWVRNVSTAGIPPSRAAPFTAAAITPACPKCTPSNIPMAQCTGAARLFNSLNSR